MSKEITAFDIDGKSYQIAADELSWRPSAYGVVIRDDQVLLSPQFHGYDLPGGGVDLGETLEEAVIREVKEETGIIVTNPKILHATTSFFKQNHKDGSVVESIMMYYLCEMTGGELSIDGFDEHEKAYAQMPEWYPISDLGNISVASSFDWRDLVMRQYSATD